MSTNQSKKKSNNKYVYTPNLNDNSNGKDNNSTQKAKDKSNEKTYRFHYHPRSNENDSNCQPNTKDKSNENNFHYRPDKNEQINNIVKKGGNTDNITFITYVEVDMHKEPKNIHNIFDWIPIIRDTILEASNLHINYVCFIPGIGSHSSDRFVPQLRPLVILTAKKLGYDCFIDKENHGVVIVDISSFTDIFTEHDLNEDLVRSSGFYSDMEHDELSLRYFNCKEKTIKKFQKKFLQLPYSCAKMICSLNDYKNAVDYATKFLEKLSQDQNSKLDEGIDLDLKKKYLQEMKTVEMCKNEYNLDQEIIERVVHEKQNDIEHIHIVLDKIINEVPNEFYINLTELIINNDSIPIETLLSVMKEVKYNKDSISNKLASEQMKEIKKSLNVIELQPTINSVRDNGLPSFLPVIEINLTNASSEKAIKTVSRIINGLADGPFAEINLKFTKNPDSNICTENQVIPQVMQIAAYNHYNIVKSDLSYKKKGYHFLVSNQNIDHIADFNNLIVLNLLK